MENLKRILEDAEWWASRSDLDVQQQVVYTSQGMFGEIQFEAEEEAKRRGMDLDSLTPETVPIPDWAKGKS